MKQLILVYLLNSGLRLVQLFSLNIPNLVEYDAVTIGKQLPLLRRILPHPSATRRQMSVIINQSTRHNIPEDRNVYSIAVRISFRIKFIWA